MWWNSVNQDQFDRLAEKVESLEQANVELQNRMRGLAAYEECEFHANRSGYANNTPPQWVSFYDAIHMILRHLGLTLVKTQAVPSKIELRSRPEPPATPTFKGKLKPNKNNGFM